MNPRDVLRLLGGISLAALMAALTRCASSTPVPVAKVDEVSMFATALATCVANNNTRVTIDACRSAVEYTYCGPGGVLAASAGCAHDGGEQ